jgi:regulator of replication initiation timing
MRKFTNVFLLLILALFLACHRNIDTEITNKEKEITTLKAQIADLKRENNTLAKKVSELEIVVEAQKKILDAYNKFDKDKFKAMKARDINITLAKMKNIITALNMYYANNNVYPYGLEELQPNYTSSMPLIDAWENKILYLIDIEHREFQLISKGADGEIYTSDDIQYVKGEYLAPRTY